jgi:uncharacterized membrane protein YcaP (DUF421 family)
MKKEDIHITDLYRIINGGVPPEFYLELVLRALFVFFVLTFGMKYLGKRLSSQLTRSELAATSTLAAATGLVIMAPDRGLLPPLIVIAVIIIEQRFVHKRSMTNEQFEFAAEGHLSELVHDGTMQLKAMRDARISKEQLFSQLREMELTHLGLIKRLYLEANGEFSLIKHSEAQPGLPVIPPWDKEFLSEQKFSDSKMVCSNCGQGKKDQSPACTNCGDSDFEPGMKS